MEILYGLMLYLVVCIFVAIVANKRDRSWIHFGGFSLAAGIVIVLFFARGLELGSSVTGFSAFASPLIATIVVFAMKTGQEVAVEVGNFGNYKKCSYCASAVRKEAIKCKYCASDLPQVA